MEVELWVLATELHHAMVVMPAFRQLPFEAATQKSKDVHSTIVEFSNPFAAFGNTAATAAVALTILEEGACSFTESSSSEVPYAPRLAESQRTAVVASMRTFPSLHRPKAQGLQVAKPQIAPLTP